MAPGMGTACDGLDAGTVAGAVWVGGYSAAAAESDTTADTTAWESWSQATAGTSAQTWSSWDQQATAYSSEIAWSSWQYLYQSGQAAAVQQAQQVTAMQAQEASYQTHIYGIWSQESDVYLERRKRQARTQRREEQRRIKTERKKKARVETADRRALELLKDIIGPEEMQVFKETGRLLVKGEKFDWMITQRDHGGVSVQRIKKGKMADLCVHLKQGHEYPKVDHVVTYALRAKLAEKHLNKEANVTREYDVAELPKAACM